MSREPSQFNKLASTGTKDSIENPTRLFSIAMDKKLHNSIGPSI